MWFSYCSNEVELSWIGGAGMTSGRDINCRVVLLLTSAKLGNTCTYCSSYISSLSVTALHHVMRD